MRRTSVDVNRSTRAFAIRLLLVLSLGDTMGCSRTRHDAVFDPPAPPVLTEGWYDPSMQFGHCTRIWLEYRGDSLALCAEFDRLSGTIAQDWWAHASADSIDTPITFSTTSATECRVFNYARGERLSTSHCAQHATRLEFLAPRGDFPATLTALRWSMQARQEVNNGNGAFGAWRLDPSSLPYHSEIVPVMP